MTDRAELTPGSDRAYDQGCICPVGGETMFWINGSCPIHGKPDAPAIPKDDASDPSSRSGRTP